MLVLGARAPAAAATRAHPARTARAGCRSPTRSASPRPGFSRQTSPSSHVPVGWIVLALLSRGARPRRASAPAGRRRARRPLTARCRVPRTSCSPSSRPSPFRRVAARGQAAVRNRRLGDLGPARARALRLRPPGRARSSPTPPTRRFSIRCCCRGSRHSTSAVMGTLRRHGRAHPAARLRRRRSSAVRGALLRDRVPRLLLRRGAPGGR